MKIDMTITCVLDVPEEQAERILDGDKTAFLSTMYTPDEGEKRGKWWIEGECVVINTKQVINV